jgi:microsomal dipeptidase-like Zn-dependent dipeptidase
VDVLAFVLALTVSVTAAVQSAEPQTGASRVALASITDPRNKPLVDVSADDFVIQEGGAAREILNVRPADYPLVVLLDNGSEARADFPSMQKAVLHFIERIGQRPLALGTFGNLPKMLATIEDERPTVMARLAEIAADTSAGSLLLQGAALAGETIRATGALFSAIVIVSATSIDASRNRPDEMIAPVVDSGAILHVIANRQGQTAGGGLRSSAALRALAEQSRGEFTVIYSASSYQAALDRLADRLTTEMMIEYLVPVGSKPNDVKVGIRVMGARVRGLGVAPR